MILLDESKEPEGLNGLLILPVAIILLFIFGFLISTIQDIIPLFREGYWELLTSDIYDTYHELWGTVIIYELFGALIFIASGTALLFCFRSKSRYFPKFFLAYLLMYLIFMIISYNLAVAIPSIAEDEKIIESMFQSMFLTIIGCIIWFLYMLFSRRVKNTFVKKLNS